MSINHLAADAPTNRRSGVRAGGQGAAEDTACPSVVDGSIPPNKSDLKTFGVYFEDSAQGRYLHMFWHRVQEPSGTTNMDFEFNQSETISGNGVTPVRTAGDALIQYDLSLPVTSVEPQGREEDCGRPGPRARGRARRRSGR